MIHAVQNPLYFQWNEEESDLLAETGGYSKYFYSGAYFYIEKLSSHQAGFGTAITRKVVKESLDKGCGGNIELQAAWTSHLFWLYMGMTPKERTINVVDVKWGVLGQNALEQYSLIKKQILEKDLSIDLVELKILKLILGSLKNISFKDVTMQMIVDSEEELNSFYNQEGSYIKEYFIPQILKILEKNIDIKRPDTSLLGSVPMTLSEEGLQRWKEAIEGKKSFPSFKKLEHLRPLMNMEQIQQLDKIMLQREQRFSVKNSND